LGSVGRLARVLARNPADEVLIAVPSATGEQMQRITRICQETGIPSGRFPLSMKSSMETQHPPVREFVLRTFWDGIRWKWISNQYGENGRESGPRHGCRRLDRVRIVPPNSSLSPEALYAWIRARRALFYLQQELTEGREESSLSFCVADISDTERMQILFSGERPQIVFHAAAYKTRSNHGMQRSGGCQEQRFGLLSLLDVAERNAVVSFVMISSDKAVNPTSVMGTTKRVCELILSCRAAQSMRCVSVRFGNVLGSNGSVILFSSSNCKTISR